MKTKLVLGISFLCVIGSLSTACTRAQTGVLEACVEYKRLADCEDRLFGRALDPSDCQVLKARFELVCSQADVDYALKTLKVDADRVCALKTKEELTKMTRAFDVNGVSPGCYQEGVECDKDCAVDEMVDDD